MAAEIVRQLPGGEAPTHVFAQAGVGALAAAICACFWLHWHERRPAFIVVEPTRADCVYQSLAAGHPIVVGGSLETVMAEQPDIVVMDVWMPGLGGLKAAEQIKAARPSTVIVLISATHPDELPVRSTDRFADAVLWKSSLDPKLLDALWLQHGPGGRT
mgnify:CR=1 FL=1